MTPRTALVAFLIIISAITSPTSSHAANPYGRVIEEISALSKSPNVRLLDFGSSGAGRSIPVYMISDFSDDCAGKARLLICSGQHGDEYNAVRIVLTLSKDLADGRYPGLLEKCVFLVVPMVNPDGVAISHRLNSAGQDINRDWMALTTKEARFVHGVIKTWKPQAIIDVHEWTQQLPTSGNQIEVARCVTGEQSRSMTKLAITAAHAAGLYKIQCTAQSDKRLFHRRYALLGYAAYLLETSSSASYSTKENAYTLATRTIAERLADNSDLRSRISPATRDFDTATLSAYLESTHLQNPRPAVFTGFVFAGLLTAGCLLVWWLKAPDPQNNWSRKYTRCLLNAGISTHRLQMKHVPLPLTSKSWSNRRLRSRYAQDRFMAR